MNDWISTKKSQVPPFATVQSERRFNIYYLTAKRDEIGKYEWAIEIDLDNNNGSAPRLVVVRHSSSLEAAQKQCDEVARQLSRLRGDKLRKYLKTFDCKDFLKDFDRPEPLAIIDVAEAFILDPKKHKPRRNIFSAVWSWFYQPDFACSK